MARYILSPAAENDIASILAWTHEHFGEQARLRYEGLLVQSVVDIAEDPQRIGSAVRQEVSPLVRTYHLWYSRQHVDESVGRVRSPRHFLLYRVNDKHEVEIGRVLHDSMDLPSQLPNEYRLMPDDVESE